MKKMLFSAVISLTLLLSLTTTSMATEGITGVETHTKDEILTMYNIMNLAEYVPVSYDVTPDTTDLTTSGELSDATLQNALDTLNFVRYIAGLNYDVTLLEKYNQYCQDGSLVMYANRTMTHTPTQPDGMSYELYRSGYTGTSSSNIAMGYTNFSKAITNAWMADSSGESNITCVGHRRWILNPTMTSTGFGIVGTYSAMYAHDNSYAYTTTSGVTWPAQTMPVEYFYSSYPWSYSAGTSLSGTYTVTLTNETSGQVWTMSTANGYQSGSDFALINNSSYGQKGCIIFRPSGATYSAGDVYSVLITKADGDVLASYTVDFFSLSDDYTPDFSVTYNGQTIENTILVAEASSWAQNELLTAIDDGYPVSLYFNSYTEDMTRGEFAHMLGMFADGYESIGKDYENIFTDLGTDPDDEERNNCILALQSMGVINGTSDTTFEPDELVTREQAAKMFLEYIRVFDTPTITQDITAYTDYNQISSWALDGMCYMNQIGVLNGNTDTTLNPQGNVTIEEAALMCYRFFKGL